MSDTNPTAPYDATTIYEKLGSTLIDGDFHALDVTVSYTRSANSVGEADKHLFIVTANNIEDTSNTMFSALDDFAEMFSPDKIQLDMSAKGPHITFTFDSNNVINTPPELTDSYRTPSLRNPVSQTVNECGNCRRQTPNAYPPITIRYRSDNPYESRDEETFYLCPECSPGHFDDAVRAVEVFGVSDGRVEQVLLSESHYYNDENGSVETEPETWYDIATVDSPVITDTVRAIENVIL